MDLLVLEKFNYQLRQKQQGTNDIIWWAQSKSTLLAAWISKYSGIITSAISLTSIDSFSIISDISWCCSATCFITHLLWQTVNFKLHAVLFYYRNQLQIDRYCLKGLVPWASWGDKRRTGCTYGSMCSRSLASRKGSRHTIAAHPWASWNHTLLTAPSSCRKEETLFGVGISSFRCMVLAVLINWTQGESFS